MSFNLFNRESKEPEKKKLEDFIRKDEGEEESAEEVMAEEPLSNEKEEKVSEKSESDNLTALSCFGWKEEKTDKWLAKCAKVWFLIMSLLYFLFGAVSFAPIIFIKNKVNSVVRDKWLSLIIGIIIYVAIIALFWLLINLRTREN